MSQPIVLYEDNNGAASLADHPTSHARTKHMDIKRRWLDHNLQGPEPQFASAPSRKSLLLFQARRSYFSSNFKACYRAPPRLQMRTKPMVITTEKPPRTIAAPDGGPKAKGDLLYFLTKPKNPTVLNA